MTTGGSGRKSVAMMKITTMGNSMAAFWANALTMKSRLISLPGQRTSKNFVFILIIGRTGKLYQPGRPSDSAITNYE